jgi:hypothetical protein
MLSALIMASVTTAIFVGEPRSAMIGLYYAL